jgi:ectoine hydroxylase-related dioxygenase (phytanoyl-CoA dioxygenase family)
MASVMIALDRSNRENGCLQVLKGSHKAGRIDHGVLEGEQVGADLRRVEQMLKMFELEYAEMEPGDGLFFMRSSCIGRIKIAHPIDVGRSFAVTTQRLTIHI